MFDITKIARQCILNIKPYVPGKPVEEVKRELGLTDVLKLASNENPLGASPMAIEAMIKDLQDNANYYPESLCPALTKKLGQQHQLDPSHFFVSNGVDGVISMIGLAFIEINDEVVTSQYSFFAYQNVTARMGGRINLIPQTTDLSFDIDRIIASVTSKTKAVFLCNPNNPTGTITRRNDFEKLLAALPENTLLISDEAYYQFANDPDYPQTVPYLDNHPNLIITRTFSKVMGLAGLRIGYAIAHPDIISTLRKVMDPFPVNRTAQAGAIASLDDSEFLERSIRVVVEGRSQLYQGLVKLGLKTSPSQTNFVFVDLERLSTPIYNAMLLEGVIVRPMEPQGLPTCLRITVGTKEQNTRALDALARALGFKGD